MSKEKIKQKAVERKKVLSALRFHIMIYLVSISLILAINFMFSPNIWWFIYPVFDWLIGISVHSVIVFTEKKLPAKRALLVHLILFVFGNLLLFLIDFVNTGTITWMVYAYFGWLIAISLHFTTVLTEKMLPFKRALIVHFVFYITTNLLLFFIDFLRSGQMTWVLIPLIFWGAGLITHIIVYKEFLQGKELSRDKMKNKFKMGKARALLKRERLISNRNKKADLSKKEIEVIENKDNSLKIQKISMGLKKSETKEIPTSLELSEIEKEELKKTESEVDVEEKEAICLVHKGAIVGTVYICPNCKTYYCLKCANALINKGEKCWTCEREITP